MKKIVLTIAATLMFVGITLLTVDSCSTWVERRYVYNVLKAVPEFSDCAAWYLAPEILSIMEKNGYSPSVFDDILDIQKFFKGNRVATKEFLDLLQRDVPCRK